MKDSYLFYKDKLKGSYISVFSEVELYVNSLYIDEPSKEERLLQLVEVFLTAQEEGKPAEKIVGRSVEEFSRTFCSDMGIRNKILRFLDSLKVFFIIELIFVILDLLFADYSKVSFFTATGEYDYGGLFLAILISVAISEACGMAVRAMMFKRKRLSLSAFRAVWYAAAAVSLGICLLIIFFSPFSEVSVPLWIVGAVCLAFLVLYFILNHKRKKEDGRKSIKMSDVMTNETDAAFANEMERIFESKNRKRAKKGKASLTWEEFLDMQEKECEKGEKTRLFYFLLPIPLCIIATLVTEFEGFVDVAVFVAIQLCVQYAVMMGMWSLTKNSIAMRRRWIESKRRATLGKE
ncbi:MAG: hypothetical protein E7647_00955 [Ruminococcaceae bacterium]|nr:hypothetical protein [Oscillospiraceae bacterium]